MSKVAKKLKNLSSEELAIMSRAVREELDRRHAKRSKPRIPQAKDVTPKQLQPVATG